MFKLLGRLFGRDTELDRVTRQFQQLKADLGADLPLDELRPVLIPSSIFSHDIWVGPYHHFENLPLSLTWAYMRPEWTMQYLSNDQAEKLTAEGIDWRSVARKALSEDSQERKWLHRPDPRDPSVNAAVVLQDELGPSRLLCLDQLRPRFPNGFDFYVPSRYEAYLLAPDAPPEIRDKVLEFVRQGYERDVPMSLEPYSHTLLEAALREVGELP